MWIRSSWRPYNFFPGSHDCPSARQIMYCLWFYAQVLYHVTVYIFLHMSIIIGGVIIIEIRMFFVVTTQTRETHIT